MESERSLNIAKLIHEAGNELADLAKWPESEMTRDEAKKAIKALRKLLHGDSYPQIFIVLSMIHVASSMYDGTTWRKNISVPGLKEAWTMIGELLD